MKKKEIFAIIEDLIDKAGLDSPSTIAFAIIQRSAEIKGGDNQIAEAMALRDEFIRIQEAFEEEFRVLMGGEGNTYRAQD